MKTLLKLFVFASVIILIAIGCQKILSDEDLSATAFNTAVAKNWYYGTFIKSPEWSDAAQKSKQLPDWKNGVVTTFEKQEAVVYPFIKEKSSFSIPGDKSLTATQCKKIADASISKIAFIKTADNQIVVKEIDYIPDWGYLQNNQFNILEINSVNVKKDFTGRIVVKNWNGNIVSMQIQVAGKTIKTGKKVNSNSSTTTKRGNTSSLQCTYYEYCVWQQDCEIIIYGDNYEEEHCGEWYNTGNCWFEEYCSEEGGGGGEPENCEVAVTTLNEIANSASTSNELISITTESETVETRTKVYQWKILTSWGGWYLFSYDKGTHQKVTNTTNPWEWNTFTHEAITQVGLVIGGSVEPHLLTATPTIGLYNAVMDIHFNVKYSVVCSISPINYTLVYNSNKMFNIND